MYNIVHWVHTHIHYHYLAGREELPIPAMIFLQAFASVVKSFGWKNFAIIYEDIDDLVHLQGLIGERQLKPSFITRLNNEITDYR